MSKRRWQGYLAKSERNSLFPKRSNHRKTFCTILQAVSPSYLGRKCCVLLASTKPIPTFPLDGRSSVNTFSVIRSRSITLFAHNTLNQYPYLRKSGKLQLSVHMNTYMHTSHKARASIMLKAGKMSQRRSGNLIWTVGWGRRMNYSGSLIHFSRSCQAQAGAHGLWAASFSQKATWAQCLNGKPAVSALKVGEGRNDQLAPRRKQGLFSKSQFIIREPNSKADVFSSCH